MAGISYVATSDGLELFIKLDADAEVVQRVAELGIAPPVVASGTYQGQTYVIQEYIQGTHPDREWFSLHLPQLATLIEKYHNDPVLRSMLSKGKPLGYEEHITAELRDLEVLLTDLPEAPQQAKLLSLFDEFKDQARSFDPVDLVPAHADPNYNNFLLIGDKVYLLDWDRLALYDPIRDIGPLLWWYVPEEKWSEFFAACSMGMDEQVRRKVYWWAARQSLWVVLWFASSGYMEHALPYVLDFKAAMNRQANPHG